MFDFKSFVEGFVIGLLFISIFWLAIYIQLKDIAKAIRNPKSGDSKSIFGGNKKAQIIRKKDDIDTFLEE